jgi:hypothetical protein
MANAVRKVREVFRAAQCPLTLVEIREAMPELKQSQISMALCYFKRQRYVTREPVKNENIKGRRTVWMYTFYETRLPADA